MPTLKSDVRNLVQIHNIKGFNIPFQIPSGRGVFNNIDKYMPDEIELLHLGSTIKKEDTYNMFKGVFYNIKTYQICICPFEDALSTLKEFYSWDMNKYVYTIILK